MAISRNQRGDCDSETEELAAIAPPEETKLGSTVVEETVEFGAQNTAKLFPIGVKLAKFKGAKSLSIKLLMYESCHR